jgi:phosphatidylserine/phosphatidylglycerophosphate/cardiolipin synthase-like enzyme
MTLLHQRTEKYSSADFLANQGVPTMIDANHAIAHNKIMIIDGETVLTGSFNFTKAAQDNNAENLLILRNPTLAAQYTQNWDAHRQHSQPGSVSDLHFAIICVILLPSRQGGHDGAYSRALSPLSKRASH